MNRGGGKEEQEARKARKCRHFRSIMEGKTCRAGVTYLSLGNGYQWPCHGDVGDDITACDKHEPYTAAEIQEREAKIAKSINFTLQALTTIKGLEGTGGEIECPKCAESLQWSRALNGHVHGICSTHGCLCWMQ